MTWAHVQGTVSKNTTTGGVSSLTITPSSNITSGNLLLVTVSTFNAAATNTCTVADTAGNTYTLQKQASNPAGTVFNFVFSAPITAGSGTAPVITATLPALSFPAMTVDEYSFAPGTLSFTNNSSQFTTQTAWTSGNVTFTAARALVYGGAEINGSSTYTAGAGFTLRGTETFATATNMGVAVVDALNVTSSPSDPALTMGTATTGCMIGLAVQSSGDVSPSFTLSPSTIPTNHSGNITLTLTGSGTSWVSGTTIFTLPTITGLTKVSQAITSGTAATIVCTTGATTGSGNITDNTDSATAALTVSAATLAISPTSGGVSTPVSIALTGTHTLWSSETASTLFTVSGGTSPSISSIVVTSNTAATATFNPGSTTGTITVTDSSTTATASFTATGALAVSPTSVVQNSTGLTLTVTGVGTSWTPGTPGSPTFTVSAGTITAQTVTSATSVTLTYNSPAASASPVTITDPSTSATASLTIATSNLANGTASTVSVGNTIATVQVANATGGTPPYSYQWYRSTTSGFTPGGGNIVAGATNQTLNDTGLINGTTYFYVNVVTDSA